MPYAFSDPHHVACSFCSNPDDLAMTAPAPQLTLPFHVYPSRILTPSMMYPVAPVARPGFIAKHIHPIFSGLMPRLAPHHVRLMPGLTPQHVHPMPGLTPHHVHLMPGLTPQHVHLMPGLTPQHVHPMPGLTPHHVHPMMSEPVSDEPLQIVSSPVMNLDFLNHELQPGLALPADARATIRSE